MAVARQLVKAGASDQPWRTIGKDGRGRVCGASLHRLAQLTMEESDKRGLRVRRFKPLAQVGGSTQEAFQRSPLPSQPVRKRTGSTVGIGKVACAHNINGKGI